MPNATNDRDKLPSSYVNALPFSELKTYIRKFGLSFDKFANKKSLLKLCKEKQLYSDVTKAGTGETGSLLALPKKKHFRTKSGNFATMIQQANEDGEELIQINYVKSKSKIETHWRRRNSLEEHQEDRPKNEPKKPPLMKRSVVYAMSYQDLKHYAKSLGVTNYRTKEHIYRELEKADLFPDPPPKVAKRAREHRKVIHAHARWSDSVQERRASIAGVASLKSNFTKQWNPLAAGADLGDSDWQMTPEEIEAFEKKKEAGCDLVGVHDTFRALNRLSEEVLGRFAELMEDVEDGHESYAFTGFVETHPFFQMYDYSPDDPIVNPYFYELDEETSDYYDNSMCDVSDMGSDSEEEYFLQTPGIDFRAANRPDENISGIPRIDSGERKRSSSEKRSHSLSLDFSRRSISDRRRTSHTTRKSADFATRRSISDRRNSRRMSRRMSSSTNFMTPPNNMLSPNSNFMSPASGGFDLNPFTSPPSSLSSPLKMPLPNIILDTTLPESPHFSNNNSRKSFIFDHENENMPTSGGDFLPPDSPKASPKVAEHTPERPMKVPPSLWTLDSPPFDDDEDSKSATHKSSKSSDSSDVLSTATSEPRFFVEMKKELQLPMNLDSTLDLEALMKELVELREKSKLPPLKIIEMKPQMQSAVNLESTINVKPQPKLRLVVTPSEIEEEAEVKESGEEINDILTKLEGFKLDDIMEQKRKPDITSKGQSESQHKYKERSKTNALSTHTLNQKQTFLKARSSRSDDLPSAKKADSSAPIVEIPRTTEENVGSKDPKSKRLPKEAPKTTRKRSSERSRSVDSMKRKKPSPRKRTDKKGRRSRKEALEPNLDWLLINKQQSDREEDEEASKKKKKKKLRKRSVEHSQSIELSGSLKKSTALELSAVPESPQRDKRMTFPKTTEKAAASKKKKTTKLLKMKPSDRRKELERRQEIQAKKDRRKERTRSEVSPKDQVSVRVPTSTKKKRTASESRRSASRDVALRSSASRRSASRDISRTPDREKHKRKKHRKLSEPVLTPHRAKKRKPRKLTADHTTSTRGKRTRDDKVGLKKNISPRRRKRKGTQTNRDEPIE